MDLAYYRPSQRRIIRKFPTVADYLPTGTSGDVRIVRKTIEPRVSDATMLRAVFEQNPYTFIPEGTYTQLWIGDRLMMSDTPMERLTNNRLLKNAHGRVLVAGLGIGMIIHALYEDPQVEHVHVIESNKHVIELVAPSLVRSKGRVTVELGDIFTWLPKTPETRYDTVYFDIWYSMGATALQEMQALRKRFRPYLAPGKFNKIMSWGERELSGKLERADTAMGGDPLQTLERGRRTA